MFKAGPVVYFLFLKVFVFILVSETFDRKIKFLYTYLLKEIFFIIDYECEEAFGKQRMKSWLMKIEHRLFWLKQLKQIYIKFNFMTLTKYLIIVEIYK